MRIPLERQQELYRQHADEAVTALIAHLSANRDALVTLGERRAFEQVGVHEYGDSTYWIADDRLAGEVAAELADAIFYAHIEIARRHGTLESP